MKVFKSATPHNLADVTEVASPNEQTIQKDSEKSSPVKPAKQQEEEPREASTPMESKTSAYCNPNVVKEVPLTGSREDKKDASQRRPIQVEYSNMKPNLSPDASVQSLHQADDKPSLSNKELDQVVRPTANVVQSGQPVVSETTDPEIRSQSQEGDAGT